MFDSHSIFFFELLCDSDIVEKLIAYVITSFRNMYAFTKPEQNKKVKIKQFLLLLQLDKNNKWEKLFIKHNSETILSRSALGCGGRGSNGSQIVANVRDMAFHNRYIYVHIDRWEQQRREERQKNRSNKFA